MEEEKERDREKCLHKVLHSFWNENSFAAISLLRSHLNAKTAIVIYVAEKEFGDHMH